MKHSRPIEGPDAREGSGENTEGGNDGRMGAGSTTERQRDGDEDKTVEDKITKTNGRAVARRF